ncbi:hypothetical protein ACJX0J_005771, partial [Zea mays]
NITRSMTSNFILPWWGIYNKDVYQLQPKDHQNKMILVQRSLEIQEKIYQHIIITQMAEKVPFMFMFAAVGRRGVLFLDIFLAHYIAGTGIERFFTLQTGVFDGMEEHTSIPGRPEACLSIFILCGTDMFDCQAHVESQQESKKKPAGNGN